MEYVRAPSLKASMIMLNELRAEEEEGASESSGVKETWSELYVSGQIQPDTATGSRWFLMNNGEASVLVSVYRPNLYLLNSRRYR